MTKSENTQNAKFAEFFKNILNDRRLSKAELSRISGISEATLSRIESGSQKPSFTTLEKLAPALNLSMHEIMLKSGYAMSFTVNADTNRIVGESMVLSGEEIQLIEKHREIKKPFVNPLFAGAGELKLDTSAIDNAFKRASKDPEPPKLYQPPPKPLSLKEERDIAHDLENILANMESDEALSFYEGEPLDAESKELLRISLENTMRLAKQMAKKKFTPKKYRKEE